MENDMDKNSKLVGLNYSVEKWVRDAIRETAKKNNCSAAKAVTMMVRYWLQKKPATIEEPVKH